MGTPLTEERFLEFVKALDVRLTRIENDIAAFKAEVRADIAELKADVASLKRDMKEVREFQYYESKTIEHELQALLEEHLKKKYQYFEVKEFLMKHLYDPISDAVITELDAAFLLDPVVLKADYSRLREKGVYKTYPPVKPTHGSIFVMAEAKHHITADKIATKLNQFLRIRDMFKAAKSVLEGQTGFSEKFIRTVKRNPYLAKIQTGALYFGAACWGDRLVRDFEADIKKYKELVNIFSSSNDPNKKYQVYLTAHALESKWHATNLTIKPKEEVAAMKQLTGSLRYVDLITPSGQRYVIKSEKEPEPFGIFVGGKTRKRGSKEDVAK